VKGADLRLRSGRIGLVSVDVAAPVVEGAFAIDESGVRFMLVMALDELRTGNFIMQAAARTLVKGHRATRLVYRGAGAGTSEGPGLGPWLVSGLAQAGDITVELDLTVTQIGGTGDHLTEIEIIGSASMGTVHLPLPGMGTVNDFAFDVDARLTVRPT
jgi:hypothetical protein